LTDDGYIFSWGSGAVGRLGHGEQKDELYPRVIDSFTQSNPVLRAAKIACGGTNSMAIDGQGMLYLWGKFKNTGDGSTGQPWMAPRASASPPVASQATLKSLSVPDVTSMKFSHISAGGVTLFAIAKSEHMVICMGQNAANGELGLGVRSLSSSQTDPMLLY
jgi:hypothetical protein